MFLGRLAKRLGVRCRASVQAVRPPVRLRTSEWLADLRCALGAPLSPALGLWVQQQAGRQMPRLTTTTTVMIFFFVHVNGLQV